MKTLICVGLLLVGTFRAGAAPDRNSGLSPETKFKARYHRWVAAIYDRPGTLMCSAAGCYTDFPEYDAIIELGKPALPAMVRAIEANDEMAMFLGEAILKITGWKYSDFSSASCQDLNGALIERLRVEGLVPAKPS